MRPLDGIRVLDATQMLAGPMTGMRLGDLGADVIKVEPPAGEFNRTHGYGGVNLEGHMTTFLALNRNKRSLAVDLKAPEGKELFLDLVRESDVFVQNFRPGVTERLGIEFESLHEINPRLVYCSISGYGQDGPGAKRPGQDLVLQGYSGSMWFVGRRDDPPTPGGIPAIDAMTGHQASVGILAALVQRGRTGVGQHVEVDMLSVVLDAQIQELVTFLNSGLKPERGTETTAHAWIPAPYGVYKTVDGYLTMAMCPIDVLGQAIGSERLRGMSYEDGLEHADEIYRIIRPLIETRTTADWMKHFDRFNIWTGPVYKYEDLEYDEQIAARGLITSVEHAEAGMIRTIRSPIRMSDATDTAMVPPPLLGEHSAEIARDIAGYSEDKIQALSAAGVIVVTRQSAQATA